MINVEEPHYTETLNILRGATELPPVFADLKAHIEAVYTVPVANFILDTLQDGRPRLRVLLLEDTKLMRSGYNYDRKKQDAIASAFRRLKALHSFMPGASLDNLFVCYSDFRMDIQSEVAKKACAEAIPAIKRRVGRRAKIWRLDKIFTGLFVFYETMEQVEKYARNGVSAKIEKIYTELLRKYDEFAVFSSGPVITFDSKENVDKNFEGNLFYYYK